MRMRYHPQTWINTTISIRGKCTEQFEMVWTFNAYLHSVYKGGITWISLIVNVKCDEHLALKSEYKNDYSGQLVLQSPYAVDVCQTGHDLYVEQKGGW